LPIPEKTKYFCDKSKFFLFLILYRVLKILIFGLIFFIVLIIFLFFFLIFLIKIASNLLILERLSLKGPAGIKFPFPKPF